MTVFQKCFKKFLPRKLTLSVPCVTITVLEVLFWVNKNPHFMMELEHNPPYWGSGQVWQTATSTTGPHGPVVDAWLKAQMSQWNMEWPVDAAYLRCDPLQLQCCKILNEHFPGRRSKFPDTSCTINMPQCSPDLTIPHTSLRGLDQRTAAVSHCCTSNKCGKLWYRPSPSLLHSWCKTRYHRTVYRVWRPTYHHNDV